MGDNTGIQWTHRPEKRGATWNPITGCIKVSSGCKFCYAERVAEDLQRRRIAGYEYGFNPTLQPSRMDQPLRWKKPRSIFVCSMSDLMQKDVPDWYIAAVMLVIYATPRHTYQVLTKRAERMARFCAGVWEGTHRGDPIDRLWSMVLPHLEAHGDALGQRFLQDIGNLHTDRFNVYRYQRNARSIAKCLPGSLFPVNIEAGTSVENQGAVDSRIQHLLKVPARIRFLSIEPLIGPVDLKVIDRLYDNRVLSFDPLRGRWLPDATGFDPGWVTERINWIIVGGESGKNARVCEGDWIRLIRRHARMAEVPVFIKQLGYRYSDALMGTAGKGLQVPPDAPQPTQRLKCKKGGNPDEWPKWIGPLDEVRALPPAPPQLPEEEPSDPQQSLL